MAKRAAAPKIQAEKKPKKAPTTLPKQFEAALEESSVDELRSYLRDLAARQRPIRADFLLYRTTTAGADDRASYVNSIRLGLKQPPKARNSDSYYGAPSAAEKRVRRYDEIAATLLRTAAKHITDRSDLLAARAICLALLEVELADLEHRAVGNNNGATRDAVKQLLLDLWQALPTSEGRENLFDELLALPPAAGEPGTYGHLMLLKLLMELMPNDHERIRAVLATTDALLTRLPRPQPAPKNHFFYDDAALEELSLRNRYESLVQLRLELLKIQQDTEAIVATLKHDAVSPNLRTQGAKLLLQLGRPAEARTLLQAGLASLGNQHHHGGLERSWQHMLMQAEHQLGNVQDARQQSLALLKHSAYRDLDAYHALRRLTPETEWPAVRADLLVQARVKNFPGWSKEQQAHQLALLDLLWSGADQDSARVMTLLETVRSVYEMNQYEALVLPQFAERCINLAEAILPQYFADHNSQMEMHQGAILMKHLAREPGARPRFQKIADELRSRFPRRTVLSDILKAAGF